MTKIVFLDRDGVINKKREDYVKNLNEIKILPYAGKAIQKLNSLDFQVIIITNQSIINRKIVSKSELFQINEFIIKNLESENARIKAVYYCPHKPDDNCQCRKPKPGMILKAIKDFELKHKNCIFIGDSDTDIQAAKNAGIKGLKIETNGNLLELIDKHPFFNNQAEFNK